MINTQRKKEILEFLSDVDYRSLKEIADKFNVSMNTVRRDINELCEENLVTKFYGGVSLTQKMDSSFKVRETSHLEEKKKIAKHAATYIRDNDLIFIDAGSTTSQLVDYFDDEYHLTIVTNNLHIIAKIIEHENWDLIVVGSKLKRSSHSLIHVHDWDYLNNLNLNKAFLATTGFTLKSGATNPDNSETIIKTNMMKRSDKCYLLTDSTKFGQTSLITFAKAEEFDKIITNGPISKNYIEHFEDSDTELIIL